jgi:hypothetical protein
MTSPPAATSLDLPWDVGEGVGERGALDVDHPARHLPLSLGGRLYVTSIGSHPNSKGVVSEPYGVARPRGPGFPPGPPELAALPALSSEGLCLLLYEDVYERLHERT